MPVSESFPVRSGMLAVGFLTAAIVLAVLIPDKGEVVRLVTQDADGQQRYTDLWIAEIDGHAFFRAGNPGVGWLARLEASDRTYLEREGRTLEIETLIENDPEIRDQLNLAMAEKYGFVDRVWGWVRSLDPVAIRIHPVGLNEVAGPNQSHAKLPAHSAPL